MTADLHLANKQLIHRRFRELCGLDQASLIDELKSLYCDAAICAVSHPVNEMKGPAQIYSDWWAPLVTSFPDLERRDQVVLAGEYAGRSVVAVLGCYQATFVRPFFDIAPTHGVIHLRYGEMHEVQDSRIKRSWILIDFVDLMHQARCWPLSPSLGTEGIWLGPVTQSGVRLDAVDPAGGERSMSVVQAMHAALLAFDGRNLESMDHGKYWTRNFMWYGPSGIGTTRGLAGFRAHHQIPFLRALPDRSGGESVYVGDGEFVANAGWPGMSATHTGGNWLGLAPTGRKFTLRVMDFYRLEHGLLAENWVPIDILDILQQLGVDVFDRMRHMTGRPRMQL